MSRTYDTRRAGFTLIEVMVVLVVISLLAGLVGPSIFRNVGDARVQSARVQVEMFGLALEAYRLDAGRFPTTEQGLEALRSVPTMQPIALTWRGPYLRKDVPLDPWNRRYSYTAPSPRDPEDYDLVSLGRDGAVGGEGEDRDIVSWVSSR